MDWKSIALVLSEQRAPTVVLDSRNCVVLANDSFSRLVSGECCLEPKALDRLLSPLAVSSVKGERFITAATADGRVLTLRVDVAMLGADDDRATVLTAMAALEQFPFRRTQDHFAYDVTDLVTRFGALARVETSSAAWHYWGDDAPLCHDILHGRDRPCERCPVLSSPAMPGCAFPTAGGETTRVAVLSAGRSDKHVRVTVTSIQEETLNGIREIALESLAEELALSSVERLILSRMVSGDTAQQISDEVAMSSRDVTAYQMRLLQKAGGHQRAALFRLLF